MNIEILYEGTYALARVGLDAGEEIISEAGAMVAMSPGLKIEGKAKGGLLKSLGRKFLSGESFFQSIIKAESSGEVLLAPNSPGDVVVVEASEGWFIQRGSFLASGSGVQVSSKAQGIGKALFSGEGLFVMQAVGEGALILSSYGAIHRIDLQAGEEYIVDNGHLVAWNCEYEIKKASKGIFSSVTSGEGLVCRFQGPGTVLLQSRQLSLLAQMLAPFLSNKG